MSISLSHFKKNAPAVGLTAGARDALLGSDVKLGDGIESGLTAHVYTSVFHAAEERSAAARGLISGEPFTAQGLEPVWHDMAVA